jgi:hypothetical protein
VLGGDGEVLVVDGDDGFADLGLGFFAEVAAFGDGPFVVGFAEHGGDDVRFDSPPENVGTGELPT